MSEKTLIHEFPFEYENKLSPGWEELENSTCGITADVLQTQEYSSTANKTTVTASSLERDACNSMEHPVTWM